MEGAKASTDENLQTNENFGDEGAESLGNIYCCLDETITEIKRSDLLQSVFKNIEKTSALLNRLKCLRDI